MGPMVRFVKMKARMMEQRAGLIDQHSELQEKMRDSVALKDVLQLVPQLGAIEAAIEKASAPVAFRGRKGGGSRPFALPPATLMSGRSSGARMATSSRPSGLPHVQGEGR